MIGLIGLILILISFFSIFYKILIPDTKLASIITISYCCFITEVVLLTLNIVF